MPQEQAAVVEPTPTAPSPPPGLARRKLGATGLEVCRLGLSGSWGIDASSVERAFHELGMNYFFVTPRMKGLVEGVKRLVAAGHRDRIVLAMGTMMPTGGGVRRSWEKCARLLGVDRIDVFHVYWVQYHWYVSGKTWPAMRELKQAGKVNALAISGHDRQMARALVDELELDALMCRYNAAHRGAEADIFASLGDGRPGIVTYTATRWGKLLKPAGELGPMTAGECYRFVLSHPRVDVALCGPKNWDELAADAAEAALGPLTPERLAEIQRFGDRVRGKPTKRIGTFTGA